MTAKDMFNQGMVFYRRNTRGDNATAGALFGEVLKATDPRDPNATEKNPRLAARACAQLAATYRQEWNFEWTADDPTTLSDTERRALLRGKEEVALALAQESVEIDRLSPYGHVQLAYIYVYRLQQYDAIREAEEAIRLGNNFEEGIAVKAQVLTYGGDPQGGVDLMLPLVQHPQVPAYYLRQLGQAYYVLGQVAKYKESDDPKAMGFYQQAEGHLTRAKEVNRQVRLTLAAVYMETKQEQKARDLFTADPEMRRHITIGQLRQQAPYKDQWIRDRYIDALRRAGS